MVVNKVDRLSMGALQDWRRISSILKSNGFSFFLCFFCVTSNVRNFLHDGKLCGVKQSA